MIAEWFHNKETFVLSAFPIFHGGAADQADKLPVKVGQIGKAAVVGDFRNLMVGG